jgi:transcriptional regulator of acetoin/glycerol metabolism
VPASSQTSKEPLPSTSTGPSFDGYSWEELERAYVLYLLEKNRWHITRAAREAGLNRSTFDSRMKRLGIRK